MLFCWLLRYAYSRKLLCVAGGKGFEPLDPFGSLPFQDSAIDHSAILPILVSREGIEPPYLPCQSRTLAVEITRQILFRGCTGTIDLTTFEVLDNFDVASGCPMLRFILAGQKSHM